MQMENYFAKQSQEMKNDMNLEYHPMFNSMKKELLDYVFSRYKMDRVAELGCVWGVEGAYGQYISAKHNPSVVTMVDTHWTEEALQRCSKYPQILTVQRNFGDANLPAEIGQVGTVVLFDVLLHQVAPDWSTILQQYAPYTQSFTIYNQQFIASPITIRLLDLGYEGYFENVPHNKELLVYQNLFNKMFEIHPDHNRIWRDVHHVWQWGITDQDLIHTMDRLGFQLDYYKNHGRCGGLKNFEEHAFFFKKK
jgi:hypothetical protein